MSKYSTSKELLCLAYCYNKAGRRVEAAKIAVKAMEEADAEELFESMDAEQEMANSGEELESLSEEDLMPSAEADFEEADSEEEPAAEEPAPAEEPKAEEAPLPPAEEAVAKVIAARKTIAKANLKTLSGTRASKVALAKFLRK